MPTGTGSSGGSRHRGSASTGNLVLCHDNNQVTCDGPLDWIVTEDTNAKLRALGWNVIDVFQGDTSVADIVAALQLASSTCGKSTMVNIRTTIGGTVTAGTAKLHHGNYKEEDAALYASPSRSTHSLSEMTRDYFRDRTTIRQTWEKEWNWTLRQYEREYPDKARKLCAGMEDTVDVDQMLLKIETPDKVQATRPFNGVLFNQLMAAVPNMMAGDADLWNYGGYPPSCSHSP